MYTQRERVLDYINECGSITALEAVHELGITQLSARIVELEREGIRFHKETCFGRNRYGDKTHWVKYSFQEEGTR